MRYATQRERAAVVRELELGRDNVPVMIETGSRAPRECGQPWCYRTRTGKMISHPSAYSKNGWSSMVYHASTRRIVVGELWFVGRIAHRPRWS